jgi:hypothetical protein
MLTLTACIPAESRQECMDRIGAELYETEGSTLGDYRTRVIIECER